MELFAQIGAFFAALVQNEVFIQCFGFFGTACVLLGMQCKSYNKLLFTKFSNSLISGSQYLMLGRFTGAATNLTACGTNIVYWLLVRKGKSTLPYQIAFGGLFIVIVLFSWDGWISIFVLLAKVISTVSLGINNTKAIRILNLFSTPCWLMYNLFVGSIAGICSDVLMITSITTALIRIDIIGARRERAQLALATAEATEKETEV